MSMPAGTVMSIKRTLPATGAQIPDPPADPRPPVSLIHRLQHDHAAIRCMEEGAAEAVEEAAAEDSDSNNKTL